LKRLFSFLGNEVYSREGKSMGTIWDMAVSKESLLKIEGFLLTPYDSSKGKQNLIPFHLMDFKEPVRSLRALGDPLMLPKDFFSKNLLFKKDLENARVFTHDGLEVGLLKDLYLSPIDGVIDCLQCSDGLLRDILKGRFVCPILGKIKWDEKKLVIHKDCLTESFYTKGQIDQKRRVNDGTF
jgi:uncharacterized protein YrrD